MLERIILLRIAIPYHDGSGGGYLYRCRRRPNFMVGTMVMAAGNRQSSAATMPADAAMAAG